MKKTSVLISLLFLVFLISQTLMKIKCECWALFDALESNFNDIQYREREGTLHPGWRKVKTNFLSIWRYSVPHLFRVRIPTCAPKTDQNLSHFVVDAIATSFNMIRRVSDCLIKLSNYQIIYLARRLCTDKYAFFSKLINKFVS